MKPPNTTPPPNTDQLSTAHTMNNQHKQQQQPQQPSHPTTQVNASATPKPQTNSSDAIILSTPATNNSTQNANSTALITTTQQTAVSKPQPQAIVAVNAITTVPPTPVAAINVAQEQQAPLALTTQHQNRAHSQVLPISTNQMQVNATISTASSITLASAPTTTGPTAFVIIPQHSAATPITPSKVGTIAKAAQVPSSSAQITLATTTQSSTIQMQAPASTIIPTLTQVPISAHQNTTLVNRPPQTLPVVPITNATAVGAKSESNRRTCCLFDKGIRCERFAGNASFSARIQKIVATKKMHFALDPSSRHFYICDHHRAIITVAKKSTTLARDTKANARNYTANNNVNTPLTPQHTKNFNDLTLNQSTMQHQMNLELLSNQSRLANNHAAVLNSMPVRPGSQITYAHYPGTNAKQMGPMDSIMSGSFETGGDTIPSGSAGVDVDLQQLQVNTLRRYKRHFRVQTRPGLNKMQLAESLKHHFRTLPIIEKEAITYFVYIVKCGRNKLDHNPKAD